MDGRCGENGKLFLNEPLAPWAEVNILHRKFIEAKKLEQYRQESHDQRAWFKRKDCAYQPNPTRSKYQRIYQKRKRQGQKNPDSSALSAIRADQSRAEIRQ